MTLTFKAIEREEFRVRSSQDHRRRVNRLVISYSGENGVEYRKRFEFDPVVSHDYMLRHFPRIIETEAKK